MAIVATMLLLVVAGFAIAIVDLSHDANRSGALQTTQTTTVAIPAATAAAPAAATAATTAAATPKRHSH